MGFLLPGFAFWHDGPTMLAIRGEHPVEAREAGSWARDRSGETGHEVERIENDVGRAVVERLLNPPAEGPEVVPQLY